ncbi:GIY-YIG nuclease family protein [Granulosicoccus antarcticus]|uniref:GIY-YIG nuclease family protein n=1 Tax=Granulosicoccus antarcticus TaxID=437505 RepID=UPI000B5A2414|nr:GIY-YIG nuclease family protein [Granulosicoccus antarcticus]
MTSEEVSLDTEQWYVYMVRCNDGSLYTGITTDLTRRVAEHNKSPRGARYTRARRPVALVYEEGLPDRSSACRQEWQIKQLCRSAKEMLITSPHQCMAKF